MHFLHKTGLKTDLIAFFILHTPLPMLDKKRLQQYYQRQVLLYQKIVLNILPLHNPIKGIFKTYLMEEPGMNLRKILIAAICLGMFVSINIPSSAQAATEKEPVITVLNPLGTPPPIEVKQMAPRLATLDGKTIYLINTGFPNSGRLLEEIGKWFNANYPKTNMVMVRAGMDNIPPNVMNEIKEKADAVILGVGH
jgi:hypothetical protein